MRNNYLINLFSGFLLCFSTSCSDAYVSPSPGSQTGVGGSMARFAVNGNFLYTVDHTSLNLFDIGSPGNPTKTKAVPLGFGIETIFPFQDKLFIGSRVGMHILSLQQPEAPKLLASYEHVISYDPVVTDGRYAYVTLRTGSGLGRGVNELQILDLKNIASPELIKRYAMSQPKGLGIDGDQLFVCDNGLKVFDATDVLSLKLTNHFKINAYDVIPNKGNLLVIGSDGFYQYSYTNQDIALLSKISVHPID